VRVLHVVESYGAGTASAVLQYVRATPGLEHHLVRRLRHDGDHADDGELAHFASVTEMAAGTLAAIRSVRAAVAAVRPDVVHGHSSFGGAFARSAVRRRRGGPLLVHTPHCYATERQDLGRPARAAYAAAERVLALNTDVVAGCSPRETDLARRVAPKARHVFVPNVTDVVPRPAAAASAAPVVTGMGRLTGQRDPLAFLEVVQELRHGQRHRRRRPVTARWIGDGSAGLADRLEAGGVEVTGWLPRTAALRLMGESAAYVHTARWDGAPMTMIEAHALRLPQVALRSPAVADGPAGAVADHPEDLAALVDRLLEDEGERRANLVAWDGYFKACTPERQRAALLEAYGADGPRHVGVTR
jgi:glycosyltransferase involved in cell wall biosynthesis